MSENVSVKIDGEEYELFLSTGAAKEITAKFGGIAQLIDKLVSIENNEEAYDMSVYMITLLANHGILKHNMKNPHEKRSLITAEYIEVMCTPGELTEMSPSIGKAINQGIKRSISGDTDEGADPKKKPAGMKKS